MGEYHSAWHKTIDILKQDGHIMFKGQEIWEVFKDENIEAMYQRLMSSSDNLFEMSSFFAIV